MQHTLRGRLLLVALFVFTPLSVWAQSNIPSSITTPDKVPSSVGTLTLRDGIPSEETAKILYERLDLSRGIDTVLNGFSGVSMYAIRKGFRDAGVADGDVLLFSKLMDSRSLFLTANADTIYFWTYFDLRKGPL